MSIWHHSKIANPASFMGTKFTDSYLKQILCFLLIGSAQMELGVFAITSWWHLIPMNQPQIPYN